MKTTIEINGMHCRSCELLLEENVSKVKNVSKVTASFKKKTIEISHTLPLQYNKIEEAIKASGFTIGTEEKAPWLATKWTVYEELLTASMILIILYILLQKFGLLSLSLSKESPAVLVGLVAGFSTCMALVGGLILGLSASHAAKHPESTPAQKFKPHLFFNLGRIISYTILGGLIGLIGEALQPSPFFIALLTILAAVLMLTVGIQLTGISPKFSNLKFTLPSSIAKKLKLTNKSEKEYSHTNAFVLGALTFFLPCGFTQAMQIFAISTGSFIGGATAMGLFALGTLPGLLGVGFLSSIFKGTAGKIFFRLAGITVIIFALINMQNGLSLVGISQANVPVTTPIQTQTIPEDGIQIIRMTQKFNGYFPNTFTIKKGIPVKWIVTSETNYSCASSIIIPDLQISTYLNVGENVIEFTPQKTGPLSFMCSMGMFRGQFNVI